MVYVFGMEGVPIFEMLFVLIILMIIGLVVLILDIKKLLGLIIQEKTDIKRFEEDLGDFESNKKPTPKLINTVKNAHSMGISHTQIHNTLKSRGWDDRSAQDIIKRANNL